MNLTKAQKEILKEILQEFLYNEQEVLQEADNYGMSRAEIVALETRMINASIILEQVLGVKGAIKKFAP